MAPFRLTPSPLAFGSFKIGRNQATKYPVAFDLPDDTQADRLLNTVLDLGVNYIDTAPAYGLSEERIGRSIAHRRAEYMLSTKVGETFEDGASTYDFSSGAVRASVERSLKRLRTDVIDLVFVHSSRDDVRVIEQTDVVQTLHDLRNEGAIRGIGFSGYTASAFRAAITWSDAIMVTYHRYDRSLEPVIAQSAAAGIMVVVKKGLDSGRLPANEAIRFVLSNPDVTSMVVGGLNADHLRQNLGVARQVLADRPVKCSGPPRGGR